MLLVCKKQVGKILNLENSFRNVVSFSSAKRAFSTKSQHFRKFEMYKGKYVNLIEVVADVDFLQGEFIYKINFDIPVRTNGDCYDRSLVRILEMIQYLNKIPNGLIKTNDTKITLPTKTEIKQSMEALIHHF